MALPLIPAAGSLIGVIVAGVAGALASKAGAILAGAGLTFIGIKGIQTVIGFMVADINAAMQMLQGVGTGGTGMAQTMMKFAAYVGLFDAINITLSGYMAIASVQGLRVMLGRLQGAT